MDWYFPVSKDGKFFQGYNEESYYKQKSSVLKNTNPAMIFPYDETSSLVLPIREDNSPVETVGVHAFRGYDIFSFPEGEEIADYLVPNQNIINPMNNGSYQDFTEKNIDRLTEKNKQYISEDGTYTKPIFKDADTPLMRATKMAITEKNINMDSYKEKFGENYPNDKRKINDTSITIFYLERLANALDLDVDIVIRDKDPNVPNPMGCEIRANIVPGNLGIETRYLDGDREDTEEDEE